MRFDKTALFTLLGLAELITAGPLLDPRERTSEEDRKALGKMKLFKGPNQYPTCDDIRQAACVIAKLNNKWLWEIMKPGPGGSPTEVKIWLWKWKQEVEGFRVWPTTVKWDDVKDTMSGAADKDAAWWPAALEVAMTNLKMPNSNDGRWGGGDPAGAFHASTGKNATTECFNWGKDRTEAERNALSNKHWASVTKADYTPVVLISTNQRERKRLMEGHAYGVMTSTVRDTTRFVTLFEPNTGSLEYKWDDIFVDLDFVTHLVNFDPLIIPKSPN